MDVLVDTSVWSLAFRRARSISEPVAIELGHLIREGRAFMIGPIRQEILSGIKDRAQFERLRGALRAFPDLPISTADYEEAAAFFNRCRMRGVQGAHTDFLICAVASRRSMAIMTTDKDFDAFARVLRLRRHRAG
ncbi:MAG: type II toxin-antitoxin system VapC family toxin [Candidatus Binataceae bacterium]